MTALKQVRQARKLIARQVAADLGITEPYYSEIENGRTPSFWLGKRIAEYLAVPLDSIFPAFGFNVALNEGTSRAPIGPQATTESATVPETGGCEFC